MARYLSWIANTALLVLCCFLVASSANAVFAALLTPPPPMLAPSAADAAPARRPWAVRQAILDRNLFKASVLSQAATSDEVSEELQATRLPLDLLGTAASPNPELAWAAVQDRDARKVMVLRVDDEVREQAKVMRIERKRIVLSENGKLRELVLEENQPKAAPAVKRSRRGTKRVAARRPVPRRPTPRPPQPAEGVRNAAEFLSQARVLPKYENGEMVGVEVNAIEAGSVFEEAGLENGDLITEVNGIPVDSPEQSAQLLMEFVEAKELAITVEKESGTKTLNVTMPD